MNANRQSEELRLGPDVSGETDSFTVMLGVKGRNWKADEGIKFFVSFVRSFVLLGGWCETCSDTNVSWSFLHHGTGPSLMILDASFSLFSASRNFYFNHRMEPPAWNSPNSGMFQWHRKTSPMMGLYGFLATELFRPAWYADKYHLTTCTILSRGSLKSAMRINRSGWAK